MALVDGDTFWPFKAWAVRALVAQGRCDGRSNEAYARYALTANRATTHLAWFRATAKKYPWQPLSAILADLVSLTPGEEGKWFAAAKDAKLFDEAIALARASPCDPRTLTRAARDFVERRPSFATEAGLTALHWLVQGHGYEITSADVGAACSQTLKAARHAGQGGQVRARIRLLIEAAQRHGDRDNRTWHAARARVT